MLPIQQSARAHPTQLAYLDGKHQIRFADLIEMLSDHAVAHLNNVAIGDHVAWCPNNDLASFLVFWALQQRGLVACPISHRFPVVTRDEILMRIDAAWLPELVKESGAEKLPAGQVGVSLRNLVHPATILLSSGSTGSPKAIVHTLGAHLASAAGAAGNMPLVPGDRWLWSLPMFHVSGVSILVRCALAGATVVAPPADAKLSASILERFQITHLSVVGTQLSRLLEEKAFPSRFLKSVLLGGSSIEPKLVALARHRGVQVMTTYGLTETASQVTTSTEEDDPATSGRVLPGRRLKISDGGEILVGGETLFLGYYRDGKIDSSVDNNGWFHTCDIGKLDEAGRLLVTGRLDNMFISGGENIHPENIERAILNAFDIQRVIVVEKADPVYGGRPVAFVLGELPANWERSLRDTLQSYEIPIEIHPWPIEVDWNLKVDRKYFQSLLTS